MLRMLFGAFRQERKPGVAVGSDRMSPGRLSAASRDVPDSRPLQDPSGTGVGAVPGYNDMPAALWQVRAVVARGRPRSVLGIGFAYIPVSSFGPHICLHASALQRVRRDRFLVCPRGAQVSDAPRRAVSS